VDSAGFASTPETHARAAKENIKLLLPLIVRTRMSFKFTHRDVLSKSLTARMAEAGASNLHVGNIVVINPVPDDDFNEAVWEDILNNSVIVIIRRDLCPFADIAQTGDRRGNIFNIVVINPVPDDDFNEAVWEDILNNSVIVIIRRDLCPFADIAQTGDRRGNIFNIVVINPVPDDDFNEAVREDILNNSVIVIIRRDTIADAKAAIVCGANHR
jgi:hypothetical protein